jgi:urea transport system permease protein
VQDPDTRLALYAISVAALGTAFLLCRFITTSKLGCILLALRDAESRVRFLGYSVTHAKLFVFSVSAVLAGFAGALYVPQVGIINPSEFSPANSIEIAIWVAVGGRGTLLGAILGAVIVNTGKSYLTGAAPDLWLFVLGGLFILVTLALPQGIVGLVRRPPSTKLAVAAAE